MRRVVLAVMVAILLASALWAQGGMVAAPAEMKFGPLPSMPACVQGAILHGDPGKTAFTAQLKGTLGCKIPWHWHTMTEQLSMVSGGARLEMRGGPAKAMTAGSYAYLPSKHQHEFVCATACVLTLVSDGPSDIHYVDASGKEMTPEEALKPARKPAAMKK